MLEHLFGSKTRQKLLRFFFNNPQKDFFVREITRSLNLQINAVRRELDHLTAAEVVAQRSQPESGDAFANQATESKKKYYSLNPTGSLNPELKALLIKDRLVKEKELIKSLQDLSSVEYLMLAGRLVGVDGAPTDLLVVGNIGSKELRRLVKLFETEGGEEIRYTLLSTKEFLYRRDVADKFLTDLLNKKTMILVDKLNKSKIWKK